VAYYIRDDSNNGTEVFHNFVPPEITSGYFLSKIIAEMKLKNASKNGFEICIYRPSILLNRSYENRNEISQDHMISFICGCLQLGVFPRMKNLSNCLRVDIAAKALVDIIFHNHEYDKIYNIANTNLIEWSDVYRSLKLLNYKFDIIPANKFINEYIPKISSGNYYNTFKSEFDAEWVDLAYTKFITSENAINALGEKSNMLIFTPEMLVDIIKTVGPL
jgi:nucleoside-diphosphate-sugar epimerase